MTSCGEGDVHGKYICQMKRGCCELRIGHSYRETSDTVEPIALFRLFLLQKTSFLLSMVLELSLFGV